MALRAARRKSKTTGLSSKDEEDARGDHKDDSDDEDDYCVGAYRDDAGDGNDWQLHNRRALRRRMMLLLNMAMWMRSIHKTWAVQMARGLRRARFFVACAALGPACAD